MKASTLVVKAFDGSKRMVIGEVDLPIMMGPCTFLITFQVTDINPSYSFILGRPWIHTAGVVTSILHQRLMFIIDDKLIIIEGEEDMFTSYLSSFRYIEADGETFEIPFQALEIAAVSRRREVPKENSASPWEKISELIKGRDTSGWSKLVEIYEKKNRFRLGYEPTKIGSRKNNQRKFYTLQDIFHGAGYKDEDRVAAIEEEDEGIHNLLCRCSPDTALNNWKAIEIPKMTLISK